MTNIINGFQLLPSFAISDSGFVAGKPPVSSIISQFNISPGNTLLAVLSPGNPANFLYCTARCNSVASVSTIFSIYLNGTSGTFLGTLTFTSGVNYGTWAYMNSGSVTIENSNFISIVSGATQDATLADISILFQLLEA